MTDAPRTVRAAVGMGAITALSRAVGFVRVLVVAAVLGATYLGNAFQSANSVSNVVFELVAAGALSSVLVPIFVELLASGDDGDAEAVAGGVLGIAMAGLGALALAGMAAAPLLARALTLGVPEEVAEDQRALVAFLLAFFLPQVPLYAAGTIATGVLHAKRRFLAAAAAPMANTAVMVASLLAFRSVAGSDPGLDLTTGERLLLALAGTGGVIAFTGVLVGACRATGFRLRPRLRRRHPLVLTTLRQAGWGVVLHTSAGVLLAGAIVVGAAVEGGVVAYQVAWVFFLAPYAIFSQPIHTAILPELVPEAAEPDLRRFSTSVRWALERIALPILPVSVLMVVLAGPAMRLVSFGEATAGEGPELLAAALAALAVGLAPYGAFLMLARASYALGDSAMPGKVAILVAVIGALVMGVGAPFTEGTGRIALIGLAHSVAHLVGAAVLVVVLQRRTGSAVISPILAPMAAACGVLGLGVALGLRAIEATPPSRTDDLVACVFGAVAFGGLLAVLARAVGLRGRLTERLVAAPVPT